MTTAEDYVAFATRQARESSPSYEALALGIAGDPGMLQLVDSLPGPKRQPNLLLGAVRHLGGPWEDYQEFRGWVQVHWPAVRATMLARATQTNEPARCATVLPVLAALPQPLALLEVGASAGLCLYPDRYHYTYGDRTVGDADSPVRLTCAVSGPVPVPDRVPEVVWRAGVDLNPLDVRSAEDLSWLEALVWPEQGERRARLGAAAEIARQDPPSLVRGDLNEAVAGLAAQAPADATLVVFHSAVLAYLDAAARERFVSTVRGLPGHWLSNEGPGVLPHVAARLTSEGSAGTARFLLALDGQPLAWTGPHGQSIDWLG